jgi:hypothetical protein
MPPTLYGLSASQVERLKRLLDSVEVGTLGRPMPHRRSVLDIQGTLTGFLEAAVAGTSALNGTPTVGTLNVYSFSSTGTVDTGYDVAVYNFAPTDATTDRWTRVGFDVTCGLWCIDTQYCS